MPEAIIAQSDVGTGLFSSATNAAASFSKLVDITSAPATGSAAGKIEVTTLTSPTKQYIADRADLPDMEFGYHYTAANETAVLAACGTVRYFLIKYSDGSGAVIKGQASRWIEGVGTGSAVEAKISIVAESVTYLAAAAVTPLLTA